MLALEVSQLTKRYRTGRQWLEALRGISLTLAHGEVLAFLGPNGAGKTTAIKAIAGLIVPDAGQIRIDGRDPHRQPAALSQLGAVLEGNRNLYWRLTAQENLVYFGALKGLPAATVRRRSAELLTRFGLTAKRDTLVQALSRGMQQKLAIAVAILHQPQLLLLDEPTLGLDVEATQAVKGLVREIAAAGCAILLTTHQLDIAEELADRVAIIQNGAIAAEATPQELIAQFAGSAYLIELAAPLDSHRQEKLPLLGARLKGDRQVWVSDTAQLYSALAILEPLPLARVRKERSSLTDVFLTLVQSSSAPDT
ncbi:MAG: ABC transporter ATP-binding protein [Spirulinaceae cyanobacterium SM2_1_0]|nr:ABC transporter ATP-binding protein [Spirulinaceae cyanobacterium SM2_1_0]